ncbi:MAG TPA: FAD-dependent oxidoreductase [Ktedonobacteraceae bacterium]|nr:FAD-dependent oxidoreductase [Ktedonobacteraceae bacterium]
MNTQASYVIVGNGIAGITAAELLRAGDAACSITIVADDSHPAYYRPALKDYLGGRLPEEKLWARPATFYREQRIRFIPGHIVGIDTRQRFAHLHDGKRIAYDRMLLANGARPRALSCPGLDLAGVSTLRTIGDYQEILRRLADVRRVVVVGSGTLALESAETLRHRGYEVTHLLRGSTLWSEVLDPVASDMVLQEERRDGIDVRTGQEVAEIVGKNGQVSAMITTSEERIACEQVLIAIGIDPQIDFIRASGIACGRGVKVDNGMRSSDPHIFAAGDVIETTDEFTGRTRVLGQWLPAIQQAQVAAYNILGLFSPDSPFYPGSQRAASSTYMNYYNATFLYGLDFVSVGMTTQQSVAGFQEIIAEPQPRSYRKVILKHGVIVGALMLGQRENALAYKRAIDHRVNLASVAHCLFAGDFDLDGWLDQQGVPAPVLNIDKEARIESKLPATPTLELVVQDGSTRTILLEAGQHYTLGRDQSNTIVLDDATVSRRHAELFGAPDGFYVRDLNSRYGVFVNKVKINNAYRLAHGDRVTIGNVQIRATAKVPSQLNTTPALTMSTTGGRPTIIKYVQTRATARVPSQLNTTPALTMSTTGGRPTIIRATQAVATSPPVVEGLEHRRTVRGMDGERIKFEIDMCIGCDRCMDACPVPLSSMVTIAQLNQATISEAVAPDVARFTHECIMCGSCVPVCPVDNHRDLLMLSLKQRLGVSWNHVPDMQRVQQVLPAGWTIAILLGRLREQAALCDIQQVPDNYLLHMVASSRQRVLQPGETLFREGEYGRDLYFILDGRLEMTARDYENVELPVAILRRGEYAGDDGMLTGQPYTASVRAQVPTLALQTPEQVIARLMELVPGTRGHFERANHARSLLSILKRLALFQGVADGDLRELMRQTPIKQYERNEQLFTEDDRGGRPARETLHIMLDGFVKVARRAGQESGKSKESERIVAYRQGGDYFAGGLDLLGDGRAVSVATINRCRVAEVPRQVMLALFQRYPEVNQRFATRLREYIETTVSTQGYAVANEPLQGVALDKRAVDANVQDGLHSLVKDGVVEGTEVLVIDLDKCIHCDECEEACARRHGHSRMNRKGMVVGNISIATACRQCQNPVCMLCSRAGIARYPNGEVYITESCIGCGICAERCPYGAISIVQIDDEAVASNSWQRFSQFFTKGAGKERARRTLPVVSIEAAGGNYAAPGPLDMFQPRNAYEEMRKKVAIKCDLCAGYSDQACVQACPTGAAVRIQPAKFFGSTEEILQRRAR